MLFSSILFIFYFLSAVLILYYASAWSRTLQNAVLLVASLLFYAWVQPAYAVMVLGFIGVMYGIGLMMFRWDQKKELRKTAFVIGILSNVILLIGFKYIAFLLEIVNGWLPRKSQLVIPSVLVPIGISFFTLRGISYLTDVYRKKVAVQKSFCCLGIYLVCFPVLIAGPIVKYEGMESQLLFRKESMAKFGVGSSRFIVGLSKCVLIGSTMGTVVDRIFSMHQQGEVAVTLAWVGIIAFALQIYYEFSGYSDMAIGLSLLFGFKLEENFNYPYIAKSVGEFWRRWNMSLDVWFRDYVYLPLGGSRVRNKDIMVRNILIVWLLTGVWYGAEWTFLFWGLWNFTVYSMEELFRLGEQKIPNVIRHGYTLVAILIGMVLFRCANLVEAGQYIGALFGTSAGGVLSPMAWMFVKENAVWFLVGILFCTPVARKTNKYLSEEKSGTIVFEILYPIVIGGVFLLCLCYIVKGIRPPFSYFDF